MSWTKDRPFQALALTGGGYRGLFTARALQEIVVAGRKLTINRGEFRLKFDQGV